LLAALRILLVEKQKVLLLVRKGFCKYTVKSISLRDTGDSPTTSCASRALLRRPPSARWRGHPWPLFWHLVSARFASNPLG